MPATRAAELLQRQRRFFETGATRELSFRLRQLEALRQVLLRHEERWLAALAADLGKPPLEAWVSDLAQVLREIEHASRNLATWAQPRSVSVPLTHQPARAEVRPVPKGCVLILGPWNYPLQLLLSPAVAALAAGNTVVLKPSELAPACSALLAELLGQTFRAEVLLVVEGDAAVAQELLAERFDHVFFTGSTAVGRKVMAAAARLLVPVTLELGGKSPCLVAPDAPLEPCCRRIAWGKFFNAGQTCVAPDYVLLPRSLQPAFVEALRGHLRAFYGAEPRHSPDYARIVNERHLARLRGLIDPAKVVIGGEVRPADRYLAPTVMVDVEPSDPVMAEEIFGPVLPLLPYDDFETALALVRRLPRPLALYVFSPDAALQQRVFDGLSFGGGCANDTILQLDNPDLPLGGTGDSGLGAYHGEEGFRSLSQQQSLLRRSLRVDPPFRYPPFPRKLGAIKRLLRFFG